MEEKETPSRFRKIFEKIYLHYSWLFDSLVALITAFGATLLFSNAISPLYGGIHYSGASTDSNFFLYSASLFLEGKVPYLEIYDHKGLYHLFINVLGLLMGRNGIYILESLFLAITLLFLLRTVRTISEQRISCYFICLLFAIAIKLSTGGGNLMGEWLTPYFSIFLYFLVLALNSKRNRYYYLASMFMGLMAGLALNSRPLELIWPGVAAIYLIVIFFKEKSFLKLLYCGLISIAFMGLVSCVFIIIAYNGGYLSEMYASIFADNGLYIFKGGLTHISHTDFYLCLLVVAIVITVSIVIFRYEIHHKSRFDYAFLLFFLTLGGVIIILPVARYFSYFYSFISIFPLLISYFFYNYSPEKEKKRFFANLSMLAFLIILSITVAICEPIIYYSNVLDDFSYTKDMTLSLAIKETIPEEDRKTQGAVLSIDCNTSVYLYGEITAGYKYFNNQSWWGLSIEEPIKETQALLASDARPKWIIMLNTEGVGTYTNFLPYILEHYSLKYESPYRNTFNIYLAN